MGIFKLEEETFFIHNACILKKKLELPTCFQPYAPLWVIRIHDDDDDDDDELVFESQA